MTVTEKDDNTVILEHNDITVTEKDDNTIT